MRYLIDGHNLIAKMPDISLDDPDDEARLVLRLKSWAAADRKRRVIVYFDGGLPGGKATNLSGGPVTVIFASAGQTADSLLIKRIRQAKNPAEYTLVSSDREIIAAARKSRMPHWRSETFVSHMRQNKSRRQAAPPNTTPTAAREDPHLSEDEIAQWLELFGPEPETPPSKPKPTWKPATNHDNKPARKRAPRHSLSAMKTADRQLSADEVAAWLELFDQDEKS